MAHDVFISYATDDRQVAEKVCAALEADGIPCWIAPRDVPVATDYDEAIVDGIASSRLLVLVLSSHSNASLHVKREIQCAYAEGYSKPVVPFRIEDVEYNKSLSYYLGPMQWLDALTPPLDAHLGRLVEHVRTRLGRAGDAGQAVERPTHANSPDVSPAEPMQNAYYIQKGTGDGTPVMKGTGDGRKPFPVALLAAGVGALVLVIVLVAVFAMRGGDNVNTLPPTTNTNVNVTPTPHRTPSPTPTPNASPTPSPRPPLRNVNLSRNLNLRRIG